MKPLAKTFGIFLVVALASLSVNAQKYEHRIDSVTFSEGFNESGNFEFNTTQKYDNNAIIKGIHGEKLSIKDMVIQIIDCIDSYGYGCIEIEINTNNKTPREGGYKERIIIYSWDEDEYQTFGEGTYDIIGERDNGEWFGYSYNAEKNECSFHFINLDKEEETIVYTTKNNKL